MEMLQTQMDRSSFELKPLQEWEVTQEKEGGRRRRRWLWRWEQALVVVYAAAVHCTVPPLRPSGCQAAAPLPDAAMMRAAAAERGASSLIRCRRTGYRLCFSAL
jgi:hypothetical protein